MTGARRKSSLLEGFVPAGFAFLAPDELLAHSVNRFRYQPKWIPFFVSAVAAVLLATALPRREWTLHGSYGRRIGSAAGFISIALRLADFVSHFQSALLTFVDRAALAAVGLSAAAARPRSGSGPPDTSRNRAGFARVPCLCRD